MVAGGYCIYGKLFSDGRIGYSNRFVDSGISWYIYTWPNLRRVHINKTKCEDPSSRKYL